MQIKVTKINHRDAWRLGLFFQKNFEIQAQLKKIGAQFSRTHACWYLDYSKEAFQQLRSLGLELILPTNSNHHAHVAGHESRENPHIATSQLLHPVPQAKAEHKPQTEVAQYADLKLFEPVGKYWVFTMHYRQSVAKKLLAIKGVYWQKKYKCYMALQNPRVRKLVHEALGVEDILPEPQEFSPSQTFANQKIIINAHPADERQMQVHLPERYMLIEKIKRFAFSQYSKANRCYLLPATADVLEMLKIAFEPEQIGFELMLPNGYLKARNAPKRKFYDLNQTKQRLLMSLPESARPTLETYLDMLLAKNYSAATMKNYGQAFIQFMRHHQYTNPTTISERQVLKYLAGLMESGYQSATGHTAVNALRFYYVEVLAQPGWQLKLPRPKSEKQLPSVLTKEECIALFAQISNTKHRLMMMLTYGSGLRISEVVGLKWGDVLFDEYKIHVKAAKGKKDRLVMLPHSLIEYLQTYKQLQPRSAPADYVFEGQRIGEPYSTRSLQTIMRRALSSSGIGKKATVHTLRHSFATHLLEGGTDIRYIQGFLGHSSIKTTTIYTHLTQSKMAKITSPLDQLPMPPNEKKKQ